MGGGWTAHPRHLLLCGGVSLHPCTAYTTTVVVAVVFIVVSTTTVTHGWRLEHPNERSGGVRVCLGGQRGGTLMTARGSQALAVRSLSWRW